MVRAVAQTEEECIKLQSEALLTKEKIIESAKEKISAMELEFENLAKDRKKQALDDVKVKNDKQMQKEIENAKTAVEALKHTVKEKEKGAISLVISCIA